MQRNCTNHCTLLLKDWECSRSLCKKKQRLVQFRCIFCGFHALKRKKNCNEIAPINVFCYIKIGNKSTKSTTNHCKLLHKDWERSQPFCSKVKRTVQFRCIFRALRSLKRTKSATKLWSQI